VIGRNENHPCLFECRLELPESSRRSRYLSGHLDALQGRDSYFRSFGKLTLPYA
jgi:hypothetical protein